MTPESEAMMYSYIKQVLRCELKECAIPMLPFNKISEVLCDLGCANLDPYYFDQNGWQIDFTQEVLYKDKRFQIEGSLWYGNWKFKRVK